MATYIDHGRPGVWPGGEAQSVREAYDRQLAQQKPQGGPQPVRVPARPGVRPR